MQHIILLCAAALLSALLCLTTGCSTNVGNPNGLAINTSSSRVLPSGRLSFSANKAVTWSITEADGGTISSTGVYTAPPFSGTYHIVATNVTTPTQQAVYTVTVTAQPLPNTFIAGPMADAAYEDQPNGANLVIWPSLSSRVVAYIIYRDTNLNAPVAVVQAPLTNYVDSAIPLAAGNQLESTTWTIMIDQNIGNVTQFNPTVAYATSKADLGNPNMTLSTDSFTITAQRVPLSAGESCGYRICTLYVDYQQNGLNNQTGLPTSYQLYLGNKSADSTHATLTAPPVLISPVTSSSPNNGVYSCQTVPSASSYVLQVSQDSSFPASGTYSVLASGMGSSVATATLSQTQLLNVFSTAAGKTIYWRMGARLDGNVLPFALSTPNADGWVFSAVRYYQVLNPPQVLTPAKRKGGPAVRLAR